MKFEYRLNSNHGYNKFKKCFYYGADIYDVSAGHCTAAMFGDYKTEQEAIDAETIAVKQLKEKYSHLLGDL